MPRAPKKKLGKKRSLKVKRRTSKSRKDGSSPRKKMVADTFQAWLENQAKRKHPDRRGGLAHATQMPTDSMQEWLGKQTVVEKESHEEVKIPLGSTDEWLDRQVAARMSIVESERPTDATQVSVEETSESTTTVAITDASEQNSV